MLSGRRRGFTLVELTLAIALTALLIALAVPSFKVMLANAQLRTAAQALHDGLQLARVEAIRRNERTIFTKNAQSGWTVTVEAGGAVVQSRSASEGSPQATVAVAPAGATQVSFNSLGRVVPNTDASATMTQLDVDVPASLIAAADSKELRITVSTGGAVRLCDPNAAVGMGAAC